MDFLVKAKEVSEKLKLLNEKIAGPAPADADPEVLSKLRELYAAFNQKETTKTATINSWFTKYKKYKTQAKSSDLPNIKKLLKEVKLAAESEIAYCLQYVSEIETCTSGDQGTDYSNEIKFIRSAVETISKNLTKKPLIPQTVTDNLDTLISESTNLATKIKSGAITYSTIESAVTQSGIQSKLIKYREPLLTNFCKLFAIEAANKTVKAENYLGFTCCLTYIVFIMKITGAKVKRIEGLSNLKKVNDTNTSSDDSESKEYKKLLGGGWLAKVIYNTLKEVIQPSTTSAMQDI